MIKPQQLTPINFVTRYCIDPFSPLLSSLDKKIALAVSVIIGVFTAGIFHAAIYLSRQAFLSGRVSMNPSVEKSESKIRRIRNQTIRFEHADLVEKRIQEEQSKIKERSKVGVGGASLLTRTLFQTLKDTPTIQTLVINLERDELNIPQHFDLEKLEDIETLEISVDSFTRQFASKIAKMPNLKHLQLRICDDQKKPSMAFGALGRMRNLESLTFGIYLYEEETIDQSIFRFAFQIPKLKRLKLTQLNFLDATLIKGIERARNLEELDVSGCVKIDVETLEALGNLPSLRKIYLHLKKVDQDIYDKVQELRNREVNPLDIVLPQEFGVKVNHAEQLKKKIQGINRERDTNTAGNEVIDE